MDAQVKEKWVAALRSGEYEQGTSALLRDGKYCCLGVLCDIVDKDGWEEKNNHTSYRLFKYGDTREDTTLPDGLRDKLNITDTQICNVMTMNDSSNDDFNTIADYIEKEF